MKIVTALIMAALLLFITGAVSANVENRKFVTIDTTKGAKINIYLYGSQKDSIREKPILLVHGFNSDGNVWHSEKNNYIQEFANSGYDVIVVDMRGNAVDIDGDHKIDEPKVGSSWGYSVRDLGDDVGSALIYGIDYLNKNLQGRNYKKADVITHSTGALAVTAYTRSLGLVPYKNNIDTIIELAPPNNGSTSLIANIKQTTQIIPSVFTQTMVAYEYALELIDTKVWIPGGRMESENLRKELTPASLFLKSIDGLGPEPNIKTFVGVGDEDWVVGDWSPVIQGRNDIGYEYFVGLDHFNFCNSELVIKALLDKLEKGSASSFFSRYKPYKNSKILSFLSGPGIDHPDDTFDVVTFAKNIDITPRQLFDLFLRIAGRKNKEYLLKYWEALVCFEEAQEEMPPSEAEEDIINKWDSLLSQKNRFLHDYYMYASEECLECPDIAILANGYYSELVKLIVEEVGEPVRIVDHTFSPSILNDQKLLLIPSGGLSGLSNSAIFAKRLSEFVSNGGTVICFSQQHGYDFNALPSQALRGYGWQEDSSCHSKACYIENFHQILSSQNEFYPDIKIDGYFTEHPDSTEILLRRTKNLMPAMLVYNFGEGIVIAATIYTDWGYSNGQASLEEINIVRDLVRWSKVSAILPEYKIGQAFKQTINISKDYSKIEMILKSPDNIVVERKTLATPIYELSAALDRRGIYCVDYILYNSDSEIIQPQTEGFYFCFSKPPEGFVQNPDFTFNITSDAENYIQGAEAIFTVHIKNNTHQSETIKCKAEFTHHDKKFTESIEAPAGVIISFDKKIIVTKTDRFIAKFYSSKNTFLGHAERGINVFEPMVDTSINTDRLQYTPGQKILIESNVENNSGADIDLMLVFNIVDSKNTEVYYDTKILKLAAGKGASWSHDFKIPEDTIRSAYKIKVDAFSNSKLTGSSSKIVDIPAPLLDVGDDLPKDFFELLTIVMEKLVYKPDAPISAKIIVNNKGEKINFGTLDIRVLPSIETGVLCGVVKDENGEAVKGAAVNTVYTNANGRYKIEKVTRGRYVLDIKAPGYDKVLREIDILGGDNNLDVSLSASKYGSLSGELGGSIGSYLLLEPIDVSSSDAQIRYACVSADGGFEFKHLPVGRYGVNIQPEGIIETININEGENMVFDSTLFHSASLEQYSSDVQHAAMQDLNEVEPNNDFDSATGLVSSSTLRGKIYDYGDEDYFTLGVESPSILNITLKNVAQGFRPYIKIYDSNRRWIDSTAGLSGENIEYSLEISTPGAYYLQLKDRYNTFSSQEEYALGVNLISGLDSYEPNPDFKTAKEIGVRREIASTIFPKGDEDYFLIDIKEKGIFYIKMQQVPQGLRPSIKIYDSTAKLISQKAGSSGEKIALETEIEQPGQYYLLVRDWYSNFSSLGQYSFIPYFIRTLDGYEPNNTKEEAYLIDFGKSYFATISTKGDTDFYKLSIPDSGKVVIYLNDVPQNIRPYIKLYKDLQASWIDSKAGAGGEDLVMEFETDSPSNYYIQVQDRYNSESSLLRYRILAVYIPGDDYLIDDPALFRQNIEISDLAHKEEISVNMPGIKEIGKYYLQVALKSLAPEKNAQTIERFYIGDSGILLEPVPNPEITISYIEDENSVFKAGEKINFRFKAINKGNAGGMCRIDFKFEDLFSQSVSEFLEATSEKDFQFDFQLPIDLEEGRYEAGYIFEGRKDIIKFQIQGIKIEIVPVFENNIFKLNIENKGSIAEVSFFAEVRCGDFEARRDFTLADTEELLFNIPDIDGQEKIYYGIYFSSGKALYLNSYLLKDKEKPSDIAIKVIEAGCSKDSYEIGEALLLHWNIHAEEDSAVRLVADLICPDSNASLIIDEGVSLDTGINVIEKEVRPEFTKIGLYRILYRLIYEERIIAQGSIFFDVGGELRIELRIDKKEYLQDENIKFTAFAFSSFASRGEVAIFIDDKEIEKKDIDLEGYKKFNFNIKASDVGQHRAYCALFCDTKAVNSNKEIFNILAKSNPNHSPVLFTIGEKKVMAGEILEFSVEAMDIDGDKLFYTIDLLPEDASFDCNTKRFFWEPEYMQIGEYFVTFRVSDGKDSAFETVKIVVIKAEVQPPSAKPLAEPSKGIAPLEVHFSADTIDNKKIVKYEWDFDGKGVYDFESLETGDVLFVYTDKGTFPVTLRVTYDKGNIDTYTVVIDIERNSDGPVILLDVVPLKGTTPCKVYFKGSVVSPMDICKYEWDFNGDGVYDASSTESGEVVTTYTSPGIYKAEFKVTSSRGLSTSQSVAVEIYDTLTLDIEPLISNDGGDVPIDVNFDALIYAKNAIQKYQWDFEGDGVFDFISTDSAKTNYTYFRPGVHSPVLKITDEKNVSKEIKKEIRFGAPDDESLKRGRVFADSKKGKAPFMVNVCFEADFDLTGAEYFWDFESDHICDLVTFLPEGEYVYYNAGVYVIELNVKIGSDFVSSCSEVIYVTDGKNSSVGFDILQVSELKKQKNICRDRQGRVELSDKTCLVLPAGILNADDVVNIKKLEKEEVLKEIILEDKKPTGEYREYKFESCAEAFDSEMIISIPYLDIDNDGFVDNREIDELTLDAYWFDEESKEWKLLSDVLIFPKENMVTLKTNHFSIFGIAGIQRENKDISVPRDSYGSTDSSNGGGSGGCFIVTAAFGTPMAEEVKVLCKFRDKYLLTSAIGRDFVKIYYHYSPSIASLIKTKPLLRALLRYHLKFLVKLVQSVL